MEIKSNSVTAINSPDPAEQKKEFIAKIMEEIGMRYDYNSKAFVFKNDFIDAFADWVGLLKMSDAEIIKLASQLGNDIEIAKINQFNFDNISGRTKSKLKKGRK